MKIRDKFKHHLPLDSIDLKHIKGQTIIELRDAKSGRLVQRTKDDNMLTKALEYFYAQGGLSNPTAFGASGIRTDALTYLLGGVLCLDTALTESDTIVRVPAGVGMTANGAKGVLNTGNPPELGSWNENESGWMQDGSYKTVYDWTTSQGNGTIACVCLTSKFGGHQGIGNKSDTWQANSMAISNYNAITSVTTGGSQALGNYQNSYFTIAEANLNDKTEVTVDEYALPVTAIDVRDTTAGRKKDSHTVALPNALQNLSGTAWRIKSVFNRGKIAHLLIGHVSNYMFESGSLSPTIYYTTFDMDTKTFGAVITLPVEASYVNDFAITDAYAVINNTMINLANTVDVSDISDTIGCLSDGSAFTGSTRGYEGIDSKWIYGGFNDQGERCFRIDLESKNALYVNGSEYLSNYGASANELLRSHSNYVTRDPRYIASINNLESPVTKDASKTMKVTYVLRFDV